MECTECGKEDELRPYGKNGTMVCFSCGMKNEAIAKAQFYAQFDAASKCATDILIGEEAGVRPLLKNLKGCPICGSAEIDALTPWTVYACGSKDYDQRPGTFKRGDSCLSAEERIKEGRI